MRLKQCHVPSSASAFAGAACFGFEDPNRSIKLMIIYNLHILRLQTVIIVIIVEKIGLFGGSGGCWSGFHGCFGRRHGHSNGLVIILVVKHVLGFGGHGNGFIFCKSLCYQQFFVLNAIKPCGFLGAGATKSSSSSSSNCAH